MMDAFSGSSKPGWKELGRILMEFSGFVILHVFLFMMEVWKLFFRKVVFALNGDPHYELGGVANVAGMTIFWYFIMVIFVVCFGDYISKKFSFKDELHESSNGRNKVLSDSSVNIESLGHGNNKQLTTGESDSSDIKSPGHDSAEHHDLMSLQTCIKRLQSKASSQFADIVEQFETAEGKRYYEIELYQNIYDLLTIGSVVLHLHGVHLFDSVDHRLLHETLKAHDLSLGIMPYNKERWFVESDSSDIIIKSPGHDSAEHHDLMSLQTCIKKLQIRASSQFADLVEQLETVKGKRYYEIELYQNIYDLLMIGSVVLNLHGVHLFDSVDHRLLHETLVAYDLSLGILPYNKKRISAVRYSSSDIKSRRQGSAERLKSDERVSSDIKSRRQGSAERLKSDKRVSSSNIKSRRQGNAEQLKSDESTSFMSTGNPKFLHNALMAYESPLDVVPSGHGNNKPLKSSEIDPSSNVKLLEPCNIREKVNALVQSDGNRDIFSHLFAFKSSSWLLRLSDIRTLLVQDEWLSANLIKYYLGAILAPLNKAYLLPDRLVYAVQNYADQGRWDTWFDKPLKSDDELRDMIQNKNQFIGLINKDESHWLLVYGRKKDNKFYVVDSGFSDSYYNSKICEALNAKFKHIEGWEKPRTLENLRSDKQMDTYSCGVFVMMHAQKLVSLPTVPLYLKIKKKMDDCRFEIATNIMKYSLSVSDYCTECGDTIGFGSLWDLKVCQNKHCNRHYHPKCIKEFMKNMEKFTVVGEKYPYNLDLDVEKWNCPACRPSSFYGHQAEYDDLCYSY